MRKRLTGVSRAAFLAAFLALAAVACGSDGGNGNNGALAPAGGATATAKAAASATPTASAAAASGLASFPFPAGVQVEFQTPLPASGAQRAAMIGYENYVDSLWYGVSTLGSSTAYTQYDSGNVLTFAKGEINNFTSNGYKLKGKIVYYDITVPQVFYNAGAVVRSCVDASGLYRVDAKTGQTVGTVFSSSYSHYQEQVSTAKSAGGYWIVSSTGNTPASKGGSAGVCI